jgi:sulfite exporter TauE/SafE/copper chaperone CopZ
MSKYKFHIQGTHCASCKILIEDILNDVDFIETSNVDLKNETLDVETNTDKTVEEITSILSDKIKQNGYSVSIDKPININQSNEVIWKAIPIGVGLLIAFFMLQKSGVLNFGIGGSVASPTTSFIIGLIASVSSCLAIVGGLVLSLSAKISQDNISDTKTFILFHLGRLVSFTILGGILGAVGNIIGINFTLTSILGLFAAFIMIFLGLNLLGVFTKNRITLSSGIFNFFRKIEHKTFTPIIIGFGTFFLPCGFTQSMQLVALSSGSFITGAIIMLAFSLGTLPVLALLSFGSASFSHSKYAPLFFKSSGVLVLGLGIFAVLTGLAGLGIINPLFNI